MSKNSRRFGAKAIAAIAAPSLMFATGAAFAPYVVAVEAEETASEVVAPEASSEAPADTSVETPTEEPEAPAEETPADTDDNDNDSDSDSSTVDTEDPTSEESTPAEETPTEETPAEETETPSEESETPSEDPDPVAPSQINRAPKITIAGPTSYPKDFDFQPLENLKPEAYDEEDGDISDNVTVVSSNVDTSQPGDYQVTFEVADSFGARVTKTVDVKVTASDEPNQAPTIEVNGPMVYTIDDGFTPDRLEVVANDAEDGDLTDQLQLIEGEVDPSIPGEYSLTYQVTDSGNLTTKVVVPVTITANKPINEVPSITINGPTTYTVGTQFTIDSLEATAFDAEDGDITDKIKPVSSNVNPDKPGTYEVVLAVTDSNGARHETIVTVKYLPKMEKINAAPVITGPEQVEIEQDADFSNVVEVLKATAEDAEDGDLTSEIKVESNDVDTSTPGNYRVTLKVTDSEGASTTKTVDVHVKPKDETVDASVNIFVAAVVNLNVGINFDDPIAVLHATASSTLDGNLTGSIKVVSSDVNIEVAGTYHITLAVTASNGTKSEKTVEVVVHEKDDNGAATKDDQQSDSSNDAATGHATEDKQQPAYRNLANTGASVLGIVVVGLALVGGGILLSRRRKQS